MRSTKQLQLKLEIRRLIGHSSPLIFQGLLLSEMCFASLKLTGLTLGIGGIDLPYMFLIVTQKIRETLHFSEPKVYKIKGQHIFQEKMKNRLKCVCISERLIDNILNQHRCLRLTCKYVCHHRYIHFKR